MLIPKKTLYRKLQKPGVHRTSVEGKVAVVANGAYGLKVLESGRISVKEMEAVRRILQKALKKHGYFFFSLICDKSITKKPAEVRMGKGKGGLHEWVCLVKSGRIFLEISAFNVRPKLIKNLLKLVQYRINLRTRIVDGKV